MPIFANAREVVKFLQEQKQRQMFYPSDAKHPYGEEAKRWTSWSHTLDDYDRFVRDGITVTQKGKASVHRGEPNISMFPGHEATPGKFNVDLDFDYSPGTRLGRRLLPRTPWGCGRPSKPLSHGWVTVSKPFPSFKFKAPKNDKGIDNFLEVRCVTNDGSVALHTLVHGFHSKAKEAVTLIVQGDGEMAHDDDIQRHARNYAIGCALLYAFEPEGKGFRHDARMAAAGFLLDLGVSEPDVINIGEAVAELTGNNVADVRHTVESTAAKVRNREAWTGGPTLAKEMGDDGESLVELIRGWMGKDRTGEFICDKKGQIIANSQENVARALTKLDVRLSFDTFAQKPRVSYPTYLKKDDGTATAYNGPLNDSVVRVLWFDIDKQCNFRPSKEFFGDYVLTVAEQNPFHPVLDYLRSLEWDKTPRIDTWLIESAEAADSTFVRAVSSIVLMAACRRVSKPASKFDEMVVLESGTQGLQKSTALRALCPREEWFSDDLPLNVESKQIIEATLGKWLIEVSDLSGMRQATVEHLKGMLSRQVDGPVRLAYGRLPTEVPRQFVILGTTNSYSYLSDLTGNRRFWPVRLGKQFDIEWLRANRDQLWAEAFAREQAGESIRLPESLYRHAELQQERRRTTDAWEHKLATTFEEDYQRLAFDEIYEALGVPIERQSSTFQQRISNILQRQGYRRTTVKDRKGKAVWGFARGDKKLLELADTEVGKDEEDDVA